MVARGGGVGGGGPGVAEVKIRFYGLLFIISKMPGLRVPHVLSGKEIPPANMLIAQPVPARTNLKAYLATFARHTNPSIQLTRRVKASEIFRETRERWETRRETLTNT